MRARLDCERGTTASEAPTASELRGSTASKAERTSLQPRVDGAGDDGGELLVIHAQGCNGGSDVVDARPRLDEGAEEHAARGHDLAVRGGQTSHA